MHSEDTADVPDEADVPAEDFHQSAGRFRLLAGRGDPVRLLRADSPGGRSAAALLEDGGDDGWFLWKGPAGHPDPELLSALLSGVSRLGSATLVLLPEWDFPEVLAAAGYRPAPPYATGLVPTGGGAEAILARMRPSTRGRVRRALRSGLEFSDDPGRIEEFYDFYAPAMVRADSPDLAPLDLLHDLLEHPSVRLFTAVHEGRVAAGSICFRNRNSLEARFVATHPDHRVDGSMNFVHFETIRRAAAEGLDHFDLSGISTGEVTGKTAGINRFKLGFGGSVLRYPTYTRSAG
ncbi:GNAT family N-acetyltransferase [Streptomyces sp. LP11]|uniref:GNAT family N-acetyltransferase n=1 Tax=Streptomyces pyxinicus TaxID=2970331 RepID=A0ABT2AY92_9ACTN|nr:GNAT family N-acetyltransferase [Streptomyces sp. LP11]MCS0600855.1 GNAT family N-acetyltransferase [Streptomyces sp. LP11]